MARLVIANPARRPFVPEQARYLNSRAQAWSSEFNL